MRLFVAVNLPAEERAAIWRAAAPLRELGRENPALYTVLYEAGGDV